MNLNIRYQKTEFLTLEQDNPNLFNRAELNIRMVDYFDSISTMVVVMFAAGIVCAMVYERTRLRQIDTKNDSTKSGT